MTHLLTSVTDDITNVVQTTQENVATGMSTATSTSATVPLPVHPEWLYKGERVRVVSESKDSCPATDSVIG